MTNQKQSEEEHLALQRAEALDKDAKEKSRKSGAYVPDLDDYDTALIHEILRAGAIAKTASKQTISVKAMRNGKMEVLEEPCGHEELILTLLLQAHLFGRRDEAPRGRRSP